MGNDGSKSVPFNKMSNAELQRVRRASLSDNHLPSTQRKFSESADRSPNTGHPFRRSLSLSKSVRKRWRNDLRQLPPVNIAAGTLVQPKAEGYLAMCNSNKEWQSYWCVLNNCTLYIYLSPLEKKTKDSIKLSDCHFRECLTGHEGKEHVVELLPKGHSVEYLATETEAEMAAWLSHLQAAVKDNSQDQGENVQREWVQQKKHELLQEVLLHKEKLQKQHSSNSREFDETSFSLGSPVTPLSLDSSINSTNVLEKDDCLEWKELVRLKQRKMSAELKIESLNRLLSSQPIKQTKKVKVKHAFDILKSRSNNTNCDLQEAEVEHWSKQLETLQLEHQIITGEIISKQQKHSWFNAQRDLQSHFDLENSGRFVEHFNNNSKLDRSKSVDSENSVTDDKSEVSRRQVKSDGNQFESEAPLKASKQKSKFTFNRRNSQVSKSSSTSSLPKLLGQVSSSKPSRLQKITKNLHSLIPSKTILRRIGSDVQLKSDCRLSLEGTKTKSKMKRISADDYLISSLRSHRALEDKTLNNIHEDADIPVPPNSRQSTEEGSNAEENILSPKSATTSSPNSSRPISDSILTSVLLALDKYRDDQAIPTGLSDDASIYSTDQSLEGATCGRASGSTVSSPTEEEDIHKEGSTVLPTKNFSDAKKSSISATEQAGNILNLNNLLSEEGKISPVSDMHLSALTECSAETDSGRGSPMTEAVAKSSNSHVIRASSACTIRPETLAIISDFEQLIQEKLGSFSKF